MANPDTVVKTVLVWNSSKVEFGGVTNFFEHFMLAIIRFLIIRCNSKGLVEIIPDVLNTS